MSGEQPLDPWAPPSTAAGAPVVPLSTPETYAAPTPPGPYPPPYGPAGYAYPTYVSVTPVGPRRTDPVSVAALVCGCLLLFPLALVLGIVGVVRTRRPDLEGRGMAVAGIVLGGAGALLALVVAAAVAFLTSEAGQEVVGIATGDRVYVEDLVAGDCFQSPPEDDSIEVIDTVDCALPHDLEAYLVDDSAFTPTRSGAPYPSTTVLDQQAGTLCKGAFTDFVGMPYPESDLDFYVVFPSQDSWDRLDDRAIICAVGDPDGPTSGTLEGSRR